MKLKPPSVYWMTGRAINDELILSDSVDGLIGSLLGPEYIDESAAVAIAHRDQWLVAGGTEWQEQAIKQGIADGSFSWASTTDPERTRLNRSKDSADTFERWDGRVPLVIVHATHGRPLPISGIGSILLLDPSTPRSFLASCVRAGWIAYGSLTTPSRVEDPMLNRWGDSA